MSDAIKWKIDAKSFAFTQDQWLWAAAKMDLRNRHPNQLHGKRIDKPGHFPAIEAGAPPIGTQSQNPATPDIAMTHHLFGKPLELVAAVVGESKFDDDILAIDVSSFP